MINVELFKSNQKYLQISPFITETIEILDKALDDKGYLYNGIWRNDKEPGGYVFVFEIERRKGRRKNLITLRPQHSFLRVEVYWSETDKHYFNIYEPQNMPDELFNEISDMYSKIAF